MKQNKPTSRTVLQKKKIAAKKGRRRSTATPQRSSREQPAVSPLSIAGVGASAGGLEAFSQVLDALPAQPGLAIVLVQHLAPQHESVLTTLLSARSKIPVVQAADGMMIERDRVYVTPPNVQLVIQGETLHLHPRPADRTQYTPIDSFLHSLAESAEERAIAIILSGTASDGSGGVRDVKAVGGITIAQDPDTAKYDGMPRAAIASGFVDLVLPPAKIASELVAIARHPLQRVRPRRETTDADSPPPVLSTHDQHMDQIFALLRTHSGVDFRRYKRATIDRRLQRRLILHKLTRLDHYVRLLKDNPAEVHALYSDILIHVTRFFRDRETLQAIATLALLQILENHSDDQPLRLWVPGCSTGEEAYSLAMIIFGYLAEHGRSMAVQLFATDISDAAIDHARSGFYPQSITKDVTAEVLRRFFTAAEGGFRINKAVRDACVFARQDLTRDPPFSKLDLILCRNVLIYLGAEMQRRLMQVFYYALKPEGFLVLGNAETAGPDTFAAVDRKLRIYQKRSGAVIDANGQPTHFEQERQSPALPRQERPLPRPGMTLDQEVSRLLQDRFAPPGVLVDGVGKVVQYRGHTGPFLEPAPGEPSLHLFKMAREGLLHSLREGLQQARRGKAAVRKKNVRVRSNGRWLTVDLEIIPVSDADRVHFLVLFDDVTKGARHRIRKSDAADAMDASMEKPSRRIASLQQELAASREYLQSLIQDLESANEELQSANEEVLSANEELQSTNEELDTAKEELQSTNEELNTVNDELHGRNEELSRVNSDLLNLLSSVQIALVIMAADLRIRRFTPIAEDVLNLIPGDVGRPISHIKPNIDCPDLENLITRVIDTVTPEEREVRDHQGNLFSLRIRPYKNQENRIEGAVLALFPIPSSMESRAVEAVSKE